MHAQLTKTGIGMSKLREAPTRVFEQAGDGALVVLNRSKLAGYIVSTVWMQRALDALTDRVLADKAIKRLGTRNRARVLNPTDL